MRDRKAYFREYQREWMRKRRYEFFKDKQCVACGSTESLELDHVDPATKVTHCVWSWAETRRLAELAKCQVLCKACHLEKTIKSYPEPAHGSKTMYAKYKCRCPECRKGKSVENAKRYRPSSARAVGVAVARSA